MVGNAPGDVVLYRPVEVELAAGDGRPPQCVVKLDRILTVPMSLLESPITALDDVKLTELREAVALALGRH